MKKHDNKCEERIVYYGNRNYNVSDIDKFVAEGDRLEHSKFGKGTVVGTIDKLIIVQFDDSQFGKRSLLGTHISIKKIDKED